MSGHSKWSTIKRQKGANDAARGKLFSKLSKAISLAVKLGGGDNPEMNYSLRFAIDAAKAENMPKTTIDRAINKASEVGQLDEVTYEGYARDGVQILIEAATDNRNRTAQIVKANLDRAGGSMGSPGSVSFNFEKKGVITLKREDDYDSQMLSLIDLNVSDIEEDGSEVIVYVEPAELFNFKEKLEKLDFSVISSELIQKPKTMVELSEQKDISNILKLFERLEDEEDVQKVFTNANFDE